MWIAISVIVKDDLVYNIIEELKQPLNREVLIDYSWGKINIESFKSLSS